jgi:hypothetical protein
MKCETHGIHYKDRERERERVRKYNKRTSAKRKKTWGKMRHFGRR